MIRLSCQIALNVIEKSLKIKELSDRLIIVELVTRYCIVFIAISALSLYIPILLFQLDFTVKYNGRKY